MYIEPIFANCTRCDALASTFAPQSISRAGPFAVGIRGASGDLSTPFILPTTNCPPTSIAPVLPAETNASASPCFTRFMPTTIDEFFFFLMAITGGSSKPITSSACTMLIRSLSYVYLPSSLFISSVRPASTILRLEISPSASTAPLTGASGALSPPIASTTTFITLPIIIPPYSIWNYLHIAFIVPGNTL